MTKWVVLDSDTRITLHHQDPKLSQKGRGTEQRERNVCSKTTGRFMLHFAFLLKVPKKSFLKLPQGYFSHKQVGSKFNFEQHLFLKNWDIPAVWHLMTFLACNNTYLSLSSPHRLLDRFSCLSFVCWFLFRCLGGEQLTLLLDWKLGVYGWILHFFGFSSFLLLFGSGSLLSSFCSRSWSCSFWDGNVFLMVLIRNLLFVPARGHFNL